MRTVGVAAVTACVVVALYAALLAPKPSEPEPDAAASSEYADLLRRIQVLERDLAAHEAQAPPRLEGRGDEAQEARLAALEERLGPLRALEARLETLEEAARAPAPEPPAEPAEPAASPEEVSRWMERLGDENENIAFSATLELGRLKDPRAVPALVETLRTHRDFYVRLGAATALGDIRALDAVPALIEALLDKDTLVRTAAHDALSAITEQSLPFQTEATESERRKIQDAWRLWWLENETRLRRR